VRIVSLLPSATEHVCFLGGRGDLVGVSHECDFPTDVVGLAVMTRPRVSLGRESLTIDRSIRNLLEKAVAVYEVEVDALRAARPDVIVTQDLCDVCAVSYDDVCARARTLGNPDVRIVNLPPDTAPGHLGGSARRGCGHRTRRRHGGRAVAGRGWSGCARGRRAFPARAS
jgi:iron complex transport system substrate-binding protein